MVANPLDSALRRLHGTVDPAARATRATELMIAIQAAEAEVKTARRMAVLELLAAGWSYADIASLLGVTRSRAHQIAFGKSGTTAKYYGG